MHGGEPKLRASGEADSTKNSIVKTDGQVFKSESMLIAFSFDYKRSAREDLGKKNVYQKPSHNANLMWEKARVLSR